MKAKRALEHHVLSQHRLLLTLLRVGVSSAPTAAPQACHGLCHWHVTRHSCGQFSSHSCTEKIFLLTNAEFFHPLHSALTPSLGGRARSSMRNGTLEMQLKDNNKSHSAGPEEGPSQDSAESSCQTHVEGSRFLPFPELLPVTQQ